MKKIRKGKKMLLMILAVVILAIVIAIIVNLVNKGTEKPGGQEDIPQAIILPETTYSDMEVKNVVMEYLKGNNQTMVSMEIHNTTSRKVENEHLTAMLIGPDENVIGEMPTWIQSLEPGEQYKISVVLKGDLTTTTQIKLVEKK